MKSRLLFCATLSVMAAAPLSAKTWIVDAAGGPGHHFKSLPPAVAAAADGDVIVVRPGTYRSAITTSKALAILGLPGAVLSPDLASFTMLTVTGLPAGKNFVLKGFTLSNTGAPLRAAGPALLFRNNRGTIHLDGLRAAAGCFSRRFGSATFWYCWPGIQIEDCAHVTISDCRIERAKPLLVTRSRVAISRSTLRGLDAVLRSGGFGIRFFTGPTEGIICTDSTVTLAQSSAHGGAGGDGARPPSGPSWVAAAPAVSSTRGALTVAGDAKDLYDVGAPSKSQPRPTSALVVNGGSLHLEPAVKLVSNPGAPPVSGIHRRIAGRPVSVAATSAGPGGTLSVTTIAPAGHTAWLFVGLPAASLLPSPFGALWISPGTATLVSRTRMGATEHWTTTLSVPNLPSLRGAVVEFQVLGGPLPAGPLRLSSAAAAVLD